MVLSGRFGYAGVWFRVCALLWGVVAARAAGEAGWDERLAETFSGRWKEIQQEQAELTPQLDGLPGIPIDDQGGTGGYASIHPHAAPARKARYGVEVRWPASARVDMVALVPARRYNARGLDAQYGMPDAFTVELIDAGGKALACVAQERNARTHPVLSLIHI